VQAVTRGQYEAAHALGLNKWQTLTRVVLPQALRITIAPTTSLFIGAVKDTSLVVIVNIYDLTGTLRLAMGDAEWRPYFVEMYVMVSAVYLTIGLSITRYGRYLERRYALK
jgi:general L-amino acid transport system permease protein